MVQVKSVWLAMAPEVAPVVLEQVFAWPETVQMTEPYGVAAPVIPVIVAVNVIDPPRTGLDGADEIPIIGVAGATVIGPLVTSVAGTEAYVESPL